MKTRDMLLPIALVVGLAMLAYALLGRSSETVVVEAPANIGGSGDDRQFEIVTLLPRDAIPAIDDPRFYPASEADAEYAPNERVLGVSIDGDSRAYSTALLNRHEIVNDTVGGRKIAVTW